MSGTGNTDGVPSPEPRLSEPAERRVDRRAGFFALAALICLVLTPITEAEFRWVPVTLTVVYTGLAVASYLDARTRSRVEWPAGPPPDRR